MVKQRWLAAALIGLVFLLSQCIPIPAKKESRAHIVGEKLDLSFVAPGISRAEVEQRLSSINTHANTPGLFWGRFLTSGSRVLLSNHASDRIWWHKNLLVSYNHAGLVSSIQTVPEEKLDAILAKWVADHPRSVRLPMRFIARWGFGESNPSHGELLMDKDVITFTPFDPEPIVKTDQPGDFADYTQRLRSMDRALARSPRFVAAPLRIVSVHPGYPQPQSLGAVRYVGIMGTDMRTQHVEIFLTPDQLLDLLQYAHDQNPFVAYAYY